MNSIKDFIYFGLISILPTILISYGYLEININLLWYDMREEFIYIINDCVPAWIPIDIANAIKVIGHDFS